MSKYNKIFLTLLTSGIIVCLGLSSVVAADELKLRSSIDNSSPEIMLKGGVKLDKKNQTVDLSLRDSDLRQVLRMLADKAGYNLVLHASVTGTITLDLQKTPLNKAFEYVMTLNQLSYWQDGNNLIISTTAESNRLGLNKSQIKPIKIKYIDAGVVAKFLNTNIFTLNKPNASSNPNVVINPNTNEIIIFGNEGDVALAQKVIKYLDVKPEAKTYEVNYASTSDIASIICNSVFGATGTAAASSSTAIAEDSNKLACSATVSITADALESLGTKGYQVYTNDSLKRITIYGGTQEQFAQVQDVIKRFDKKQPQAYIEVSIIELSEAGSKALSSTWQYSDGRIALDAGYSATSTGGAWSGTTGTGLNQKGQAVNPYDPAGALVDIVAVPAGISWKGNKGTSAIYDTDYGPDVIPNYVKSIKQNISMLITQNKARLLSNPKIIATNNQKSTIDITTEYLDNKTETTLVPVSGPTQSTVTYTKGSAGIQFDITPKISPNGYIYLDLNPSYIQPGAQLGEGVNIILTYVNQRKLDLKNVRVKDGETLVIGGLMQEYESNTQSKTPLLSEIPLLGMLFKASSTQKNRSELIIMVTPKIIKDNDSTDTL
jgi:type II secretory pathway component GspD/PulD (secretin)